MKTLAPSTKVTLGGTCPLSQSRALTLELQTMGGSSWCHLVGQESWRHLGMGAEVAEC